MKPAPFRYVRARTLDEALTAIAESGGEGKLVAGGQSLVPMLNFRLVRPAVLVDINRLAELDYLEETSDGGVSLGALSRHQRVERSAVVARRLPVVKAAVSHIGHLAIRNRGTIGGSLAHADPTAEWPLMSVLLDAKISVRSVRGARMVEASAFFDGPLTTVLEPDEILTGVVLPGYPGRGWAFEEFARRSGDYALAAVAVLLEVAEGRIAGARVAIAGGGGSPMRVGSVEAALTGHVLDDRAIAEAANRAREDTDPASDLQVSADYRRQLIGVLVERAVRAAWRRAQGE